MKKFLLIVLCSIVFNAAFSQYDDDEKTFNFGLGGQLSLPVADFHKSSNYGVGFHALATYAISENADLFAQAGLDVFKNKYGFGDADNILHVPLIFGARLRAGGFCIGGGAGYGIYSAGGSSYNGFLYSPQVGYVAGHYQVLLNYTSTSITDGSLAYVGLKLFRTF